LDNVLGQSPVLKSGDSKSFQILQALSAQLGGVAKRFDGKLQESVLSVSKEIDKLLEKKLKASKRDIQQWKLFVKDINLKDEVRETLINTQQELIKLNKGTNSGMVTKVDETIISKIDSNLKQLLLLVTPNDFGRDDTTIETKIASASTDTKKPIKALKKAINAIKYTRNGNGTKVKDATPTLTTKKQNTNKTSGEEEDDYEEEEEVKRVRKQKALEKIKTDPSVGDAFQTYQKKLAEITQRYEGKILELEDRLKQYEGVSKKRTTIKPIRAVTNEKQKSPLPQTVKETPFISSASSSKTAPVNRTLPVFPTNPDPKVQPSLNSSQIDARASISKFTKEENFSDESPIERNVPKPISSVNLRSSQEITPTTQPPSVTPTIPLTHSPTEERPNETKYDTSSRSSTPSPFPTKPQTKQKIKPSNKIKRRKEETPREEVTTVFPNDYGITPESAAALPLISSLILETPNLLKQPQVAAVLEANKRPSSLPYLFNGSDDKKYDENNSISDLS